MQFTSYKDDASSVEAAAASNGRNAPPGFPQRRNQMSPREKCYTTKQKTSPTAALTKKHERRTKSEKRRASDENYAQMRMNLIAFGEKIEELKSKFQKNSEVLKFLYGSPFAELIKAYETGEIQIKKSDWDVIHIVNWYDTEMKMFKFKNGYSQINADDVQRVYGIPNKGKQAPQSTKDSRIPKIGENKFVDTYFRDVKRITRKHISDSIDVAFAARTNEGNEDAACLIILYLLFTLLLGSSAEKLPWSFAKRCNSIASINQYNWAKEIARYLVEGIDRAQSRKKDKQRTVSGSVVLLMYWVCDRTNIIKPKAGKENSLPTAIKWDLSALHYKIHKNTNEQLEMNNAKAIDDSVKQMSNNDDDDYVVRPPALKRRKSEKKVTQKESKAKKVKTTKQLMWGKAEQVDMERAEHAEDNQETRPSGLSSGHVKESERREHDLDVGGAPHMIVIDNLEKELSPSTIMEFIHQQLSISCKAFVSPSKLLEMYARGAILLRSKRNFDKLLAFLETPDHIIVSSGGRPWLVTEKLPLLDSLKALTETFAFTCQRVSRSRTGTCNELKVVVSGTKEYEQAKQLHDLFKQFAKHQCKLHQRLVIEEGRILQPSDPL